jgi:hypothetical protein
MTKWERTQLYYVLADLQAHAEFTTDEIHKPKVVRVIKQLEVMLCVGKDEVKGNG